MNLIPQKIILIILLVIYSLNLKACLCSEFAYSINIPSDTLNIHSRIILSGEFLKIGYVNNYDFLLKHNDQEIKLQVLRNVTIDENGMVILVPSIQNEMDIINNSWNLQIKLKEESLDSFKLKMKEVIPKLGKINKERYDKYFPKKSALPFYKKAKEFISSFNKNKKIIYYTNNKSYSNNSKIKWVKSPKIIKETFYSDSCNNRITIFEYELDQPFQGYFEVENEEGEKFIALSKENTLKIFTNNCTGNFIFKRSSKNIKITPIDFNGQVGESIWTTY